MATVSPEMLLAALERYWGSREFRPLQQGIIEAVLAGRDVAAVMPTGGGKSLCYQLPALFLPGTAVVVSPLIALMKDQVDWLNRLGIRAAALNSSTAYPERQAILRETRAGLVRLLYVAPERLLREDTVDLIRQIPVSYYAIDEAHCISEWGHEFRPDYRRLAELRQWHPEAPLLAFTASATRRVRHDILAQLAMRDPAKFIRSFERQNLRYLAHRTDEALQGRLLEAALEAHAGSSVIVYASTIALVEQTVQRLNRRGRRAAAYHARLPPEERRGAQERWMGGSPPVLVGTVAFGMGIDKPDVRAVIHLSLPKSLDQYYQEAGRAGRDGEPSDCLLLWKPRDSGVIVYFLKQIADEAERQRAWRRCDEIRNYAEGAACRHIAICRHFGEPATSRLCGMCDICGPLPEWYERALSGGPSSLRRDKRAPSGEPSTLRRDERAPSAEPSTLRRDERFPSAEPGTLRREERALSAGPRAPRDERAPSAEPSTPRRKGSQARRSPVAGGPLFEKLRAWRLEIARREKMPPFVIFHDSVLHAIASSRPGDLRALAAIRGLGPVKLEKYGGAVIELLRTAP